jgi:hypothetical protein
MAPRGGIELSTPRFFSRATARDRERPRGPHDLSIARRQPLSPRSAGPLQTRPAYREGREASRPTKNAPCELPFVVDFWNSQLLYVRRFAYRRAYPGYTRPSLLKQTGRSSFQPYSEGGRHSGVSERNSCSGVLCRGVGIPAFRMCSNEGAGQARHRYSAGGCRWRIDRFAVGQRQRANRGYDARGHGGRRRWRHDRGCPRRTRSTGTCATEATSFRDRARSAIRQCANGSPSHYQNHQHDEDGPKTLSHRLRRRHAQGRHQTE